MSPKLPGAEKSIEKYFWALFSDPHIAADRAVVNKNVNMTDYLARVVQEVIGLPTRPAGAFVNGIHK